jgi:hypothetical protein
MTTSPHFKSWRRVALALSLPACFLFWFVTAPASMAVQRIAAVAEDKPVARFIIRAADSYKAPMNWLCQFPSVNRFYDSMSDWWRDALDAPETTP